MTHLQKQALSILTRDWSLYAEHRWLCHPECDCIGDCDLPAIPERIEALDFAADQLEAL